MSPFPRLLPGRPPPHAPSEFNAGEAPGPFVSEAGGLNQAFVDLEGLVRGSGEAPWRHSLVGTPGLRVVLLCWPARSSSALRVHPAAEEIFSIVAGRTLFTIGDEPEREVGPGSFLLAERGVSHLIRVPEGREPLLLLAAVAPNEDWAEETIELA